MRPLLTRVTGRMLAAGSRRGRGTRRTKVGARRGGRCPGLASPPPRPPRPAAPLCGCLGRGRAGGAGECVGAGRRRVPGLQQPGRRRPPASRRSPPLPAFFSRGSLPRISAPVAALPGNPPSPLGGARSHLATPQAAARSGDAPRLPTARKPCALFSGTPPAARSSLLARLWRPRFLAADSPGAPPALLARARVPLATGQAWRGRCS